MAFLQVKVGGQDGVVDSPRVLEGTGETSAQPLGGDQVSIAKARAVKGDDEPPTGLLNL